MIGIEQSGWLIMMWSHTRTPLWGIARNHDMGTEQDASWRGMTAMFMADVGLCLDCGTPQRTVYGLSAKSSNDWMGTGVAGSPVSQLEAIECGSCHFFISNNCS